MEQPFVSHHKVRTFETDIYGHVNNAIYLNYLEFARMEVLEQLGFTLPELRERGYMLMVYHISINYRFPAQANDYIRIETRYARSTKASVTFAQSVLRDSDNKLLTEAEVTWITANLEGKPVRLPEFFVNAFQKMSESDRI